MLGQNVLFIPGDPSDILGPDGGESHRMFFVGKDL